MNFKKDFKKEFEKEIKRLFLNWMKGRIQQIIKRYLSSLPSEIANRFNHDEAIFASLISVHLVSIIGSITSVVVSILLRALAVVLGVVAGIIVGVISLTVGLVQALHWKREA